MDARSRLCFALDAPDLGAAARLLGDVAGEVGWIKVGLELFTAEGPPAVRAVTDAGARCFLDLKLHDIPATMARAVEAAARLGAGLLTVHAAAGPTALGAARRAAEGTSLELVAVTVLTSMDAAHLHAIGVREEPSDAVLRLARLARDAGIPGLVASPRECARLRAELGADPRLIVPGVRPAGSDPGDQRRTATPGEAIAAGADVLVVGRPIRDAPDRRAATRAIVAEIAAAASPATGGRPET